MSSKAAFEVGMRVRDADGYRATVMYVGPVAAAKNKAEAWLGVQWDDGSRGKHDGSCVDDAGNLHRYFDCPNGAGSFVKPSKVSSGVEFMEALNRRYVSLDAPEITEDGSTLSGAFVTTAKGHQKGIEFVGEKKVRKYQQLSTIDALSVRNDVVSSIGILKSLDHIIEADLQDNLLWKWAEVFSIGDQMPLLQTLLLHGNKLQPLTDSLLPSLSSQSFKALRVLALNSCGLQSWAGIQLLDAFMPSLQELYLADNDLSDLPRERMNVEHARAAGLPPPPPADSPVKGFENLIVLDLSHCKLDEWSQVMCFSKLPELRQLVLDANAFDYVLPISDGDFPLVQRVSLSSSQIGAWDDVNALATLPSLNHLRLSHIPLFTGKGASEVRPIVIGRIAQLSIFNGSSVSNRERRDAEKAYIRDILRTNKLKVEEDETNGSIRLVTEGGGADTKAESTDDSFDLTEQLSPSHPRLKQLISVYGSELAQLHSRIAREGGSSIASELVDVTMRNMSLLSMSKGKNSEPVTKKLPATLNVGRLKLMVKQLTGIEPHLQQLSLRLCKDREAVPTLLDDDAATLSYYGINDGSDIFINEADEK
jgi:Leucine-rich repeat (LRR) protein